MTVILLTSAIDIKPFRALMAKHNLAIVKEEHSREYFHFYVKCASDELEDIMIYTNMEWEFGAEINS